MSTHGVRLTPLRVQADNSDRLEIAKQPCLKDNASPPLALPRPFPITMPKPPRLRDHPASDDLSCSPPSARRAEGASSVRGEVKPLAFAALRRAGTSCLVSTPARTRDVALSAHDFEARPRRGLAVVLKARLRHDALPLAGHPPIHPAFCSFRLRRNLRCPIKTLSVIPALHRHLLLSHPRASGPIDDRITKTRVFQRSERAPCRHM